MLRVLIPFALFRYYSYCMRKFTKNFTFDGLITGQNCFWSIQSSCIFKMIVVTLFLKVEILEKNGLFL